MRTLILLLFLSPLCMFSQDNQPVKTISYEDYIRIVIHEHPLAHIADLQSDWGDANWLEARGEFDPKLYFSEDLKNFAGKEYFRKAGGALVIPTWYGVKFKAAYDQNSGYYLNPENKVPDEGLLSAGVSLSLGKGFVIDKRRAMRQKAFYAREASQAMREAMRNSLRYEAGVAWWQWVNAWQKYQIANDGIKLARTRYLAVSQSHSLGDKPAIDTLEVATQVRSREIALLQAALELSNARLEVSNYLWIDGRVPLELDSLAKPDLASPTPVQTQDWKNYRYSIAVLTQRHPELRGYELKTSQLEVEQKYRAEMLKPTIDLQYNVLSAGDQFYRDYPGINDNYKWGINFSFPLFLRSERGALTRAQIAVKEYRYKQEQKQLELTNKALASYYQLENLDAQVKTASHNVQSYEQLLEGEKQKFDIGESSLFLVNYREQYLIDTQIKLADLQLKLQKAWESFRYSISLPDPS